MNSAHTGDTIIVDPGVYRGNIDFSRTYPDYPQDIVIMAADDNPANTTIIANNSASAVNGVISISKKTNITVKGFTISGATRTDAEGYPNLAGIYLDRGIQCTIENNVFVDDGRGVSVSGGHDNVIRNNIVERTKAVGNNTHFEGIKIDASQNTTIAKNTVSNNDYGIHISGISKGSSISENSISKNTYGIFLENTKGVIIDRNTLNSNYLFGIDLAGSSENQVINNNVDMLKPYRDNADGTKTNNQGIQIIYSGPEDAKVGSNSNLVSNNTVKNADHGIFSNSCQYNTIQNNIALENNYGIAMRYTHYTKVINNDCDGNRNVNSNEGIFLTYDDSWNTVSGNSASDCDRGIELTDVCGANNIVDSNIVNSNDYYGIYVQAPGNTISNNSLSVNTRGSISLAGSNCTGNIVSNNILTENSGNGIYLLNTSGNNRIIGNRLISNDQKGIEVFKSNNSFLDSNYAQENDMGIQVENSNGATINNNTAIQNRIGIRLYYTDNNRVTNNNASYSGDSGFDLNSATNNIVAGNYIIENDVHGITMCPACRNNTIYNNYFKNDANAGIQNSLNNWYTGKTKGKNVVGGPYIGGNFWATRDGDGFSQTATDKNGDGIADTNYTATITYNGNVGTIFDLYPLVYVITPAADFSSNITQGIAPLTVQFTDLSQNADSRIWNFGDGTNNSTELNPVHTFRDAGNFTVRLTASNENGTDYKLATITVGGYIAPPVLPVADFNANPSSGYVPLTVQFTDASQYATGWSWTFGDGVNSTDKNTSHTYNSTGTYNVNLTVSNANGTNSKLGTITVQSHSSSGGGGSSSSSSSSGGSGGGGGSPEPQSNVEVKEISQAFITYGSSVRFDFPQKVTPVQKITFDSKKTVGKTSTIVESLKAKSTLVTGEPSNEVYKYLNIWVGNGGFATENNIGNAVVSFKVAKSWVQDKQIDKSSITLNRYSDNTWKQLSTSLSGEDDSYLYFTAQTAAFSSFAITGKSTATVQPGTDKPAGSVNETQNNTSAVSTPANTGNTPEQKESPSPTNKSPGFETVFAIAGLLAVFLYRKK